MKSHRNSWDQSLDLAVDAWQLDLKGPSLQGLSVCHEEHITVLAESGSGPGTSTFSQEFIGGFMEPHGIAGIACIFMGSSCDSWGFHVISCDIVGFPGIEEDFVPIKIDFMEKWKSHHFVECKKDKKGHNY